MAHQQPSNLGVGYRTSNFINNQYLCHKLLSPDQHIAGFVPGAKHTTWDPRILFPGYFSLATRLPFFPLTTFGRLNMFAPLYEKFNFINELFGL
jgi:hypothetical protein